MNKILASNKKVLLEELYSHFNYSRFFDCVNSNNWKGYIPTGIDDTNRIIESLYDSISELDMLNDVYAATGGFTVGITIDNYLYMYFDYHIFGYNGQYLQDIKRRLIPCYLNYQSVTRKLKIEEIKKCIIQEINIKLTKV